MLVLLTGVVIGLVGSVVLAGLLKGLLYGISTTDPMVFCGVTLLVASVATAASCVPAMRAAHVNPVDALHYE